MTSFIMRLMYADQRKHVACTMYKDGVSHLDVVRLLIERGSDVTVTCDMGTPRDKAVLFGHDDIARELA